MEEVLVIRQGVEEKVGKEYKEYKLMLPLVPLVQLALSNSSLKGKQLPNKCGELIAALHFILASKLLRKLNKERI